MEPIPEIKEQLEILGKSNQFSGDFLEFHEQVLTFQAAIKERVNKPLINILARTTDLENRLPDGRPLIDDTNLYIDPQVAQSMVQELLDLMERWQSTEHVAEIQQLKASLGRQEFDPAELVKNFLKEKKDYFVAVAEQISTPVEQLLFIARTIELPLLEVHRDILRPNSITAVSDWLRPYCPTCGSVPAMGRLDKEVGQRFLWCAVCNSQWPFQRLQCPICLNNDQTRLRYFFTDEASPYRVDVCDNCRHYLKAVDERKLENERQAVMGVEDLLTLSLDEAAKKEGYQSALWWMEIGSDETFYFSSDAN